MHDATYVEDHGEWLSFSLPLGDGHVPVKISREAMEHHFDAQSFKSLAEAYRQHAEQVHLRVAPLAGQTPQFTRDKPLVVHSADLH